MTEDITPVYPDDAFNQRQRQTAGKTDVFAHLDFLANLMDTQFVIPGTTMRFGIDPLLGLIPGFGDTLSLAISAYILHHAFKYDVPHTVKMQMIGNVMVDWLIGSVPVLGDAFDVAWKANRMNVDLLKKHARRA